MGSIYNIDLTTANMDKICEYVTSLNDFFQEKPHIYSLLQADFTNKSTVYPHEALVCLAHAHDSSVRKGPAKIKRGRSEIKVSYRQISVLFDMSLTDAADILGISAKTLMIKCRGLGISAWPYRFEKHLLSKW